MGLGIIGGMGAAALASTAGVGTLGAMAIGGLAGAGIGAGAAPRTGGTPLRGASTGGRGGLGAPLGGMVGGAVGAGAGVGDALIGAAAGGIGNAATGGNFLTGALTGGLSGYGGSLLGSSIGAGAGAAGAGMGAGTAAGSADAGGGPIIGSASGAAGSAAPLAAASGAASGGEGAASSLGGLLGGKTFGINNSALALGALAALGSAGSKPAISTQPTPGPGSVAANMGPYFNMPLGGGAAPGRTPVNPLPGAAPTAWNTYGTGPEQTFFTGNSLSNYGFRAGGSTHRVGALEQEHGVVEGPGPVRGPGDGQDDAINARLADGEFIFDATTTSRLGNGSNRRGAQVLEAARRAIAHDAGSDRVVQKKIRKGALEYISEAQRKVAGGRR